VWEYANSRVQAEARVKAIRAEFKESR
jgi:hypothetical protein